MRTVVPVPRIATYFQTQQKTCLSGHTIASLGLYISLFGLNLCLTGQNTQALSWGSIQATEAKNGTLTLAKWWRQHSPKAARQCAD